MAASNYRKRGGRPRRAEHIVNIAVFTGYAVIATAASALKAWETTVALKSAGWLPKTNAIIWDTITLYAALGALALGVREMVLAYFMRKGYEEDIGILLKSQETQVEFFKALTESMAREREERQREWERHQQEREHYRLEREERNRQFELLMEQNRLLLERLDRRDNGRRPGQSGHSDPADRPGQSDPADRPDQPDGSQSPDDTADRSD